MKRLTSFTAVILIVSMVMSFVTINALSENTYVSENGLFTAPTCESLTDNSSSQDRWLSLPDSRLVVNPYISGIVSAKVTQSDFSDRMSVPMNIGYASPYIKRKDYILLADSIGHLEKQTNAESQILFNAPATEWTAADPKYGHVEILDNGDLYFENTANPEPVWQRFQANTFSAKVTKNTYLSFEVVEVTNDISCKISFPEGEWVDYECYITHKEGFYEFKVADVLGKTGNFRIRIDFYCTGENAHITIRNVMMINNPRYRMADECDVSNNPAVNTAVAHYQDENEMTVKDCLADEISVLRNISYSDGSEAYIYGKIHGNAEMVNNSLLVDMGDYQYSVTSSGTDNFVFYDNYCSLITGKDGRQSPEGCGFYLLKAADKKVNIVLSLDTKYSRSKDELVSHSENILKQNADEIISDRISYWNDLLSKIPVPGKFTLSVPDADKTSQQDIERMYYKSWTLIIASVLPVSPEIGYNFRTLANGKPSLWSEGGTHSQYVAMWDSVYGIRMLAYIDPQMAWDCFEGLMGDVEEDGSISGEGLPDQKAHTLWHLYRLCPDRERMVNLMDAMERHTEFSLNHTYWIYPTYHPDPEMKASLYTETLANEAIYLSEIYNELGNTERATYWTNFATDYRQSIQQWHFANGLVYDSCIPVGTYLKHFDHSDNLTTPGQGLIYVSGLRSTYKRILINDFKAKYNPGLVNGGFEEITAQGPLYMMYGYAKVGENDISKTVCEVTIRDVSRTIMPAERCDYTDGNIPMCGGVRPSFFTAALIIEGVCLRNNIRIDDGIPTSYNLFDSGRISNIHIGSKVIDISVDNGKATVSGDIETVTDNLKEMSAYIIGNYNFGAIITGDADENGTVTIEDALAALRTSLKMNSAPQQGSALYAMDMNKDGFVTIVDVTAILKKSVQ